MAQRRKAQEEHILEVLAAVVRGLERVVGPNVEVIAHDMRRPECSTIAIANGHVTGRRVGDPIIAGPLDDKGFDEVMKGAGVEHIAVTEPYVSRTRDGRELRSVSVILRDGRDEPFASLCVNVDLTPLQLIGSTVAQLLDPRRAEPVAQPVPERSIDQLIDEIVYEAVAEIGRPVVAMQRAERVRVVRTMRDRGLFLIKGSVERVARVLGVTRYTVYNYLGDADEPGRSDSARSSLAAAGEPGREG